MKYVIFVLLIAIGCMCTILSDSQTDEYAEFDNGFESLIQGCVFDDVDPNTTITLRGSGYADFVFKYNVVVHDPNIDNVMFYNIKEWREYD